MKVIRIADSGETSSERSDDSQYVDFTRGDFLRYWEFETDGIAYHYGLDKKKRKFTTILSLSSICCGVVFAAFLIFAIIFDKFIAIKCYDTVIREQCTIYPPPQYTDGGIHYYSALCSDLFMNITLATTKIYGQITEHELAHIYCVYDCPVDSNAMIKCGEINATSYWTTANISKCMTWQSDIFHNAGNICFYIACAIFALYVLYLLAFSVFIIAIKIHVSRRARLLIRPVSQPPHPPQPSQLR